MSKKIRVLLVDDHKMMRDGLSAILAQESRLEVVGEAHEGRGAIEMAQQLAPDVVVMDVALPGLNGMEATRQIAAEQPSIRVVALSTYSDRRYVQNMLLAGARGYVLKLAAGTELVRAIEAVHQGQWYLSPEITGVVVDGFLGPPRREVEGNAYVKLGAREREVLQLLAEGMTSKEIGERLGITVKTVETHRRNISHKTELHSVAELTKYAIREGLTSLDA